MRLRKPTMFNKKRKIFQADIQKVYNKPTLVLSPLVREKLAATAQQLANGGKISALAADLFPYLLREKAHLADDPDFDALFTLVQTQASHWRRGLLYPVPDPHKSQF